MENTLLRAGSWPAGAPRGGNRRQHSTRKRSARQLLPRKCSFRAAKTICQCRSTPLKSFHPYVERLVPLQRHNEDFCLLNPPFHCPNHFQELLTKGKRQDYVCRKCTWRGHINMNFLGCYFKFLPFIFIVTLFSAVPEGRI